MLFKRTLLSIMFLYMGNLFQLYSQSNLLINNNSGTVLPFELYNVRKITFQDQVMQVIRKNAGSSFYSLANVRFLNFTFATDLPENQIDDHLLLQVAPNPVEEQLRFLYKSANESNVNYHIVNMDGKVILQNQSEVHVGKNEIIFQVSVLPNGLYVLMLFDNGTMQSTKFMKK